MVGGGYNLETNALSAQYLDVFSGSLEWAPLQDSPVNFNFGGGAIMDGDIIVCEEEACYR